MEKFSKKYKKIRQIGRGAFGKIFLVQNRQEDRLAVVKVVDISGLNDMEAQAVLNEIRIMEMLEHPYTVRIFDHLILQKSISIVMQYAEGARSLTQTATSRQKSGRATAASSTKKSTAAGSPSCSAACTTSTRRTSSTGTSKAKMSSSREGTTL